jgi:hypothetical protein
MTKVIYVTLHKGLKRAVERSMQIVGIAGFDVIEECELWEYIDKDYRFVFDEYYAALVETRIKVEQKKINPIFYLG